MLVEPNNGLAESLLLGPLLGLVVQVTADGEAVSHAAEQVDLPRLTSLDQSLLGLVAELGGEDAVGLCFVLEEFSILKSCGVGKCYIPAAAMEKGPLIAPSSSWVTKEGCAL